MGTPTDNARPTKFANEAKREGKSDMPGSGDDKFMYEYIAGKSGSCTPEELKTGEGPQMEVTCTDPEKVHGQK
jgi:hypothetical protein